MIGTPADAEFWSERFQNWQSEFLSIGVLLVLGLYLRERGSPEAKPMAAPHHDRVLSRGSGARGERRPSPAFGRTLDCV
jgi:hypothetical protein